MSTAIDPSEQSASLQVAELLAEDCDTDPLDLAPLHKSIDPDALDALFTPASGEPTKAEVTFSHYGHEVTVSYDGEVVITVTPE